MHARCAQGCPRGRQSAGESTIMDASSGGGVFSALQTRVLFLDSARLTCRTCAPLLWPRDEGLDEGLV